MNSKINQTIESRKMNLETLKKDINKGEFDKYLIHNRIFSSKFVVVTSKKEEVFDPKTDKEDWMGRLSQPVYVLTKHDIVLSNFIFYIRDNIIERCDRFLYAFIGLLANDYIKQFGESNDYTLFLNHIVYGVSYYCDIFYFNKMENRISRGKFIRFYLSDKITNEEIYKKI